MDNFDEIKKNLKNHFRVAIFGSAKIQEGDDTYRRVKHLAEELGKRNIDVITGGGPGLMKAASEGHKDGSAGNDADTIGIGVDLPWKQQFNDSVEYREQLPIFSKRLDEFMLLSNAVVVEPGGLGTLLELFYTWQLTQVHHICNIPIILIGEEWEGLLKWIKEYPLAKKYLTEEDYNLVFHVKNSAEALEIIDEAYGAFKIGGENFCLNYKKYKID
jgi:uncharacterized protein (TIGR00730 family)